MACAEISASRQKDPWGWIASQSSQSASSSFSKNLSQRIRVTKEGTLGQPYCIPTHAHMKRIIVKQPTTDCGLKNPLQMPCTHLCREKLDTQLLKELAQGCRGSVTLTSCPLHSQGSYLVELDCRDGIVPSLPYVATNISSNLTK